MAGILFFRLAAAGFHQRDAGGAERAPTGLVGDDLGAVAAEERHAEIELLRGAVDEDADAHDVTPQPPDGVDGIPQGAARGHNVVDDEDALARRDAEAAPELPAPGRARLGEDAAQPSCRRPRIARDDPRPSAGPPHLGAAIPEVLGEHSAKLAGIFGVLQHWNFSQYSANAARRSAGSARAAPPRIFSKMRLALSVIPSAPLSVVPAAASPGFDYLVVEGVIVHDAQSSGGHVDSQALPWMLSRSAYQLLCESLL